ASWGTYILWSWEPVPSVGPKWLERVPAMAPVDQVREVDKKLKARNAKFAGPPPQSVEQDSVIVSLTVITDNITDIEPLKVLKGLRTLKCNSVLGNTQRLDLVPLQALRLIHFECAGTGVDDLAPLEKMALVHLNCSKTN